METKTKDTQTAAQATRRWLWRLVRRNRPQAEPIPRPIRTHGCANFWYDHGCPDEIGAEIEVAMTSGKTAVFRLSKIEPATGVDWSWYDLDFVRYLPSPNVKDEPRRP